MRKLSAILFLFGCLLPPAGAQTATPAGTPAVQGKKFSTSNINAVTEVQHDTCLGKKFSVVFYIVQDSSFSLGPANAATITPGIIATLNNTFKRICVSFENCSTVFIPNYSYNRWNYHIVDQAVTAHWYTPKTINIYLVRDLYLPYAREMYGYAHAPSTPGALNSLKDVLVLQYWGQKHALQSNSAGFGNSTVLHVMGHYFGLPDTFFEIGPVVSPGPPSTAIFTYEYADGSNCATNGDGFCDTEADPYNVNFYDGNIQPAGTWCFYLPGVKDGMGRAYTPPLDNFMSMYACRCRFTQQQYNHMARFILKNRMYLH